MRPEPTPLELLQNQRQKEGIRKRSPMASATGMPAFVPDMASEEATPLLGRPGPIKQPQNSPLPLNFVSGWAPLALLSAITFSILTIVSALSYHPFIPFLIHPIAQSLCLLFVTMSILVLQPTHTAAQKQKGQKAHAFLMMLSLISLLVGVSGIEYNKIISNGPHFHSPHGTMGVLAAACFLFQYIWGFTMLNVTSLYGGDAKAKAIWKHHRRAGYLLFLFMVGAIIAAGKTTFVEANMYSVVAPAVLGALMIVGVLSRVRKEKMGF